MVSAGITKYKENDYRNLSIQLQKEEADLIINKVSRNLINAGIDEFFTIHDAIYTVKENLYLVKDELTYEFSKLGIRPTIKTKQL